MGQLLLSVDHDDNTIAFGSGSSRKEAEQGALTKFESGDSDNFEE